MISLASINTWPWYKRLPLKWTAFGLATLIVCNPHPVLLFRHLQRLQNPNDLIEPNAPALAPMIEELRPQMSPDLPAKLRLQRVERYVLKRIPYEWDWNTWGNADYLPTVAEVVEMGREDCDGRAVVAASLLRHFGFQTELVSDFSHVWVKTDRGETMGPGEQKIIVATKDGLKIRTAGLTQIPKAMAYGIAVFPLRRELILVVVMWLLMIRRDRGAVRIGAAIVLLVIGLLALREGGGDYLAPTRWLQFGGGATMLVGTVFALARPRRVRSCHTQESLLSPPRR